MPASPPQREGEAVRKHLATSPLTKVYSNNVKRLIVVTIVAAMFAMVIAVFVAFRTRSTPTKAVLPNPDCLHFELAASLDPSHLTTKSLPRFEIAVI